MSNKHQKRGIFRRISIMYALIMALAVIFVEVYITDTVRENSIQNLRTSLAVQAALISEHIPFQSQNLDSLSRQLKKKTGSRVTIVAQDGRVIGDSDNESIEMDNHRHRQEIQQAALHRNGTAIRYSETVKHDFLYIAVRADRDGMPAGFVRLAMPLREVDRAVNLLRIKILIIVLSIILATGMFSLGQIERIRRLTNQIRDFARALASGEVGKKLFLHREGEFDEIAGSLNTMSDELKSSIAIHEEEQRRLNTILRNIPDALFIIDDKGTIILSSLAAKKIFGEIALQGKPFVEVVRNKEFLELFDTVRTERKPATADIRLDTPFEQFCVVQVSPLFYQERILSGFVAIFHDITQLKRLEETRKDFVANISHEIRTPITAIRGFADTLLDGALEDRENALRFLQTIKSNSERINALVEDLLMISRLELGAIAVEKKPVDLNQVADDVIMMLKNKAAGKKLSLEKKLIREPHIISADRDKLTQILANLVDNGIKFTDRGGVVIGEEQANGQVYLYVQDTGIGIARKHLARLGERFYRVEPGRSREAGGTGLGLAIVKHLVKAHGWDMQIESVPGKGSKVKIMLS